MFRRREPEAPKPHRGRVFRDGAWWRYTCTDCDYGAGSVTHGFAYEVVMPWLVELAIDHASVKPSRESV